MIEQRPRIEAALVRPGAELVPGYEVVAHLRRGHRLDVYETWCIERQARCIVKLVRPDRISEPHTEVYLRREGELLRDLAHPHLVRVYELVEEPQLAIVMETLTGLSLSDVVDEHGRLVPLEVALLGLQLASALRYLHRRACIHGDVSPGNVVLQDGTAKLIDLSLAGPPGPITSGTGTSGYRSPEQVNGGQQDETTDVWGLGAVLFEALNGFTSDEPPTGLASVLHRARYWQPTGAVRHRVAEVIKGCMRDDAAERLTLDEVSRDLGALVDLRQE